MRAINIKVVGKIINVELAILHHALLSDLDHYFYDLPSETRSFRVFFCIFKSGFKSSMKMLTLVEKNSNFHEPYTSTMSCIY